MNLGSFAIAFAAGLLVGFALGTTFGLWLGKNIGYAPSPGKTFLAILTVCIASIGGFAGWHYLEVGHLPSIIRLTSRPDWGPEYSVTVRNCLANSGALAAVVITCLAIAIPDGRQRRAYEEEIADLRRRAKSWWQRMVG